MELARKLQKELEAAESQPAIKEPTKVQSDFELAVKLAKELEGEEKKSVANNNDEMDYFKKKKAQEDKDHELGMQF
jgi:anaerobic selenocysteine-containing dehydrogenase